MSTAFLNEQFSARRLPYHDCAISLLASNASIGSMKNLDRTALHRVSELREMWMGDSPFWIFAAIRHDLVQNDIHPPLYFWLLHIWRHFAGNSLYAALWLNIPLYLLCAWLLKLIGHDLGFRPILAASMACFWLISCSNFIAANDVRQYVLFTLFLLIGSRGLIRWMRMADLRAGILLALSMAGMMLCQYLGLLFSGLLLFTAALPTLLKRDFKSALLPLFPLVGSLMIVLILHPQFISHQQKLLSAGFAVFPDTERLLNGVGHNFRYFFLPYMDKQIRLDWNALQVFGMLSAPAAMALPGLFFSRKRGSEKALSGFLLLFCVLLPTAYILLYLGGRLPSHAMLPRYVMMLTPCLLIPLFMGLQAFSRRLPLLILALFLAKGFNYYFHQASFRSHEFSWWQEGFRITHELRDSEQLIVLTDTDRANVPRMLWSVHADSRLILASESDPSYPFPPAVDSLYILDYDGPDAWTASVMAQLTKTHFRKTEAPQVSSLLELAEIHKLRLNRPEEHPVQNEEADQ